MDIEKKPIAQKLSKSYQIADEDLLAVLEGKSALQLHRYLDFLITCLRYGKLKIADDFLNKVAIETNKTFEDSDYVADIFIFWNIYRLLNCYKDKMMTPKSIEFLRDLIESIVLRDDPELNRKLKYNIRVEMRDPDSFKQHFLFLKDQLVKLELKQHTN